MIFLNHFFTLITSDGDFTLIIIAITCCLFVGALFILRWVSKKNAEIKAQRAELIEKNKALTDANRELLKRSNELSQFSYTVSHNLRGPVASLLGLVQIMDNPDVKPQPEEVNGHIKNEV